jgi:predicted nucleic acid-binding protein
MKFADLAAGQTVFLDANLLVDHFSANPTTGPACRALLDRVARQDVTAFTATHVVGEMAHRLMTIEACAVFGWPYKGIAVRLASHPAEVQRLVGFRRAIDALPILGIHVLSVESTHLSRAADVIQRHGLLYNDAMIVALMGVHGIVNLASNDADFDCVPGIIRFAPS